MQVEDKTNKGCEGQKFMHRKETYALKNPEVMHPLTNSYQRRTNISEFTTSHNLLENWVLLMEEVQCPGRVKWKIMNSIAFTGATKCLICDFHYEQAWTQQRATKMVYR